MLFFSPSYIGLGDFFQGLNNNQTDRRAFAEDFSTLADHELIAVFKKEMENIENLGEVLDEAIVVDVTNSKITNLENKIKLLLDEEQVKQELLGRIDTAMNRLDAATSFVLSADETGTNHIISDVQNILVSFISKVEVERGKRVSEILATELINDANAIIAYSKLRDIYVLPSPTENHPLPLSDSVWQTMEEKIELIPVIVKELKNRGYTVEPKVVLKPGLPSFIGYEISKNVTSSKQGGQSPLANTASGIHVMVKSKEKTTLMVNNDSDEYIFSFQIKVDGKIKHVKVKGWDRERIDESTIIVKTNNKPVVIGEKLIITLITDNPDSSLEWSATNMQGIEISKGRCNLSPAWSKCDNA